MTAATQKTPEQWGDLVRAAYPSFNGRYPRVQIFHGMSDYTVAPANATELVEQWTNVWKADATASKTETIGVAKRTEYANGSVELYAIANMGHGIAIGDDGSGVCPARIGAFFSDVKLCSTLRAAAFFGLLDENAPEPPTGEEPTSDDSIGGCNASRDPSMLVLLALLALRRRTTG